MNFADCESVKIILKFVFVQPAKCLLWKCFEGIYADAIYFLIKKFIRGRKFMK